MGLFGDLISIFKKKKIEPGDIIKYKHQLYIIDSDLTKEHWLAVNLSTYRFARIPKKELDCGNFV